MTLLNPYTGGGGERVDNIINSTSTHSLVITSELTTGAWSTITSKVPIHKGNKEVIYTFFKQYY